jgi:hypothetical protein
MKYFGTKYIGLTPFVGYLITRAFICNLNEKASAKRKAFRVTVILSSAALPVAFALSGAPRETLPFSLFTASFLAFASAKFTKFCDWRGAAAETDKPGADKRYCRRCDSEIH